MPDGWPDWGRWPQGLPFGESFSPSTAPVQVFLQPLSVTTLQLAPDEVVVDCVVGDTVYFEVQCADNLVYLKGHRTARRTRLTVSTVYDRLYAFDLFALNELRPDHILRVSWPGDQDDPNAPGTGRAAAEAEAGVFLRPRVGERESAFAPDPVQLGFASIDEVAVLEAEIEAAERELSRLAEDSAQEMLQLQVLGQQRLSEYLYEYPTRVEPRYRLTPELQDRPFFVSQIWTDGRFTYLRSHSEESPVLYEITGVDADEDLLINFQLSPDGLYVVDHVMGAGYARLHGSRADWFVWDVPPLRVINETQGGRLPTLGPDWIRTRSQRSWVVRHPRLTTFLAIAGGVYAVFGVANRGDGRFCWTFVC